MYVWGKANSAWTHLELMSWQTGMRLCMGIFSVAYVHVLNQDQRGNWVPKEIISSPKYKHVSEREKKQHKLCSSVFNHGMKLLNIYKHSVNQCLSWGLGPPGVVLLVSGTTLACFKALNRWLKKKNNFYVISRFNWRSVKPQFTQVNTPHWRISGFPLTD